MYIEISYTEETIPGSQKVDSDYESYDHWPRLPIAINGEADTGEHAPSDFALPVHRDPNLIKVNPKIESLVRLPLASFHYCKFFIITSQTMLISKLG